MENAFFSKKIVYTIGLQGVGIEDGAQDVDGDEGDEEIAGE